MKRWMTTRLFASAISVMCGGSAKTQGVDTAGGSGWASTTAPATSATSTRFVRSWEENIVKLARSVDDWAIAGFMGEALVAEPEVVPATQPETD